MESKSPSEGGTTTATATTITAAKSATQHTIVETTSGLFFIVSKLSSRTDVQLITVEPQRGALRYNNIPGRDLFDTMPNALQHIEAMGHTIKSKTLACAILGYFVLENMGCLLVATKVTSEPMFFGGHLVNTVAESSWIKIPLSYPFPPNKTELKNFDTLSSFQVDGLHYYCETFDLTRPFPSPRPPSDYTQEFCWNDWLAKSFANIGMRDWCPVLLQGAFKCKHISESDMSLCLVTRKSNSHPGTRFFARGLNKDGHPGNEMECEIILWSPTVEKSNAKWCSHVWRRGTVPVWWKSEPKKGVGDPDITVRKEKPFDGCEKYISTLLDTFGQPLYILSLLRTEPTKGELTLSQHYHQALQYVKHFMSIDATILDYDWHANIKQLGNDKTIEGFWNITKHPLERVNISEGSMLILPEDDEDLKDCGVPCEDGKRCVFDIKNHQNGVCRFNCADSLDRTNVATFFYCFQVLAEMCKRLGSPVFMTDDSNAQWTGFSYDYRTLAKLLGATKLTSPLADFFINSGDISSLLYTNSLAAHSGPMREHSSNPSAAPNNTLIAIQRRYQNMVHDQLRQSQYEMFCGLSKEKYFPSLARPVLELISDFPSFVISSANPEITVPQEIIQGHNVCWTAPVDPTTGKSTAEATIMLRAPAEVREIAVTFGPNADPAMDPCTLEVSVGAYLNALHPVYNGLPLPSPAAPCTQLIYPVPPSLWDIYDETYLKGDEQNNHSHKRSIVRFVKVVLCGPGKEPLCIGKIDVFGTIPRPERTPEDTRQTLKAQEIEGNARALVSLLKTATLLERHSTTSEAMVTQKHASPALDTLTPEPCEADIDDDIPAGAEEDNDDNDNDSDETAEQDKGGDAERLRIAQAEVQRLREEFELQSSPEHLSQTFFGNLDFTGTTPNRMESCLRDYEEAVRALVAGGKAPTYTGVLELELTRLNLKITSAERDTIIALAGRKSQDLSPAHFRYLRDEKLEDALYQTSPNPQRCRCGEGFKLFSRNYTKCAYCREKLCPACMHPKPFPVPHFCWDTPHRVCKSCAADILYQRDFTNKIQAIYDFNEQDIARRSPRSFSDGLFTQVQAAVPEVALTQVSNSDCCCCLLSAFPGAGFAGEVPCADGSSPAEVLLVSDDLISSSSAFWAAPCDSARSVRLTVCLPQKSAVSSVTVFPPSYEGECCDDMPALSAEVVESPLMVGGSASTNSKTALAKAGAAMSCEFPTPPLGCAVIITASLPQDGRKDAQIRLGKIAVHGKFVYDTDEPKKAKLISDLPQDALRKKSTLGPVFASKNSYNTGGGGGKGWVDISVGLGKGLVQGFTLCIEHGEEGTLAQVRLLRVTAISTNSRGDPEKVTDLGVFVVPLCKNGTVLSYTFDSPREVNIVRIEHFANYGHKEVITTGKLSLFVTKSSKQ